jgi:hypothetical protein
MVDIYDKLIEFSKTTKAQNLFCAAKEVNGIRIFRNTRDFSQLQELYLSYLYNFDSLNREILIDKISNHVLDDRIYWESYFIWKKSEKNKKPNQKNDKERMLSVVIRKDITFPNKENK